MKNIKIFLEKNYKLVMILPFYVILTALFIYPLIFVFYTSLTQKGITGDANYIGLSNYIGILMDKTFWHSSFITIKFSLLTLTSSLLVGFLLAALFDSVKFPGKKIILGFMVVPMLMTPSAIGLLWQQMYNPSFGIINRILASLSLPTPLWTTSSHSALISVAIMAFWRITPFTILVSTSGLSMIPREIYDAAKVDGANAFETLVYITIPFLRNLLVIIFIFQMITVIKYFAEIFVVTFGGPADSTLLIYLYTYRVTFEYGRLGYGSALGMVLFLIILFMSYLVIRKKAKD